jgi:hypothetical protein
MKWKTREGKETEVKDMTSSHAENCVLMLMRNNGPHKILEALLYAREQANIEANKPKEVELNGDMAQEFNDISESIWNDADDMYPFDPNWD